MSKVMIAEDDDSLREIYAIRLTAEGYAVVSARDGEEALAVAVKERPDLIVSDVMMPKITGFDMLDILRSTPETANIKVIMMTALSSEDQRERGENLGADRYLVKSQVGIEDVVNTVHEVLGDRAASGVISPSPAATPAPAQLVATPVAAPTPTTQTAMPQNTGQMVMPQPAMPALDAATSGVPAQQATPSPEAPVPAFASPAAATVPSTAMPDPSATTVPPVAMPVATSDSNISTVPPAVMPDVNTPENIPSSIMPEV